MMKGPPKGYCMNVCRSITIANSHPYIRWAGLQKVEIILADPEGGQGQVTWTDHQATYTDKQHHTLTFTPTSLDWPFNLECMCREYKRKWENPEETCTDTERTWKLHIERSQAQRLNPASGISCCEVSDTHCTSMTPSRQLNHKSNLSVWPIWIHIVCVKSVLCQFIQ